MAGKTFSTLVVILNVINIAVCIQQKYSSVSFFTSHVVSCYKDLCNCKDKFALCAGNGFDLTYIPRLPKHIDALNFTGNILRNITEETFHNLTDLKLIWLYLPNNRISCISSTAFKHLLYLERLELSKNPLTPEMLQDAFQGLSNLPINSLALNNMNLTKIPEDFFRSLSTTNITELIMKNNPLKIYNQTDYLDLIRLQHVTLDGNRITRVNIDVRSTVNTFSLNSNKLLTMPNFCQHVWKQGAPVKALFLDYNYIDVIDPQTFRCLLKLETISITGNPVRVLQANTFSELPSLNEIFLTWLTGPLIEMEGHVFNNSHLSRISLTGNSLIVESQVDPSIFDGCDNLKYLDFDNNLFSKVSESVMKTIFRSIHSLQYLNIGNCGLSTIPKVITQDLVHLRWLALHKNYISSWPSGTFENMSKLTHLFLTANKITTVKEMSFPKELIQRLKTINLADNPFSCTCDLLWFIKWFRSSMRIFKQAPWGYLCSSPKDMLSTKIINVKLTDQSCLLSYMTTMVILFGSSIVLLAIVVVSLLYRYRWYLRYYIFMVRYDRRRQQELWNQEYEFDAFVVYCSDDRRWVIDELLTYLEDTEGLKLCIHDRDFIPGAFIVDNIQDNLEKSRKIIVVLSENFSQSQWCQFEIDFMQRHVLERGHDLFVVVMLEEINPRHATKSMHMLLKTTTYITWRNEVGTREMFWKRLRNSLVRPGQ